MRWVTVLDIAAILMMVGLWSGPLSGIGLTIFGFANGDKALGIGAITGAVVVPLVGIAACFMVLFIAFGF